MLLQADPGETNLISVEGSRAVVIRDSNVPITVAGAPMCMPIDAYAVRCSASVRHIDLDLEDGPDVAVVDTPREVSVEGSAAVGRGRPRRGVDHQLRRDRLLSRSQSLLRPTASLSAPWD